ncbi:MAG: hypothetical protein AB7U41_01440 [Dongiaceae bacterium]
MANPQNQFNQPQKSNPNQKPQGESCSTTGNKGGMGGSCATSSTPNAKPGAGGSANR